MKKLTALKLALLALAIALTGIAAFPAPGTAAETGVICWDEGHACHVLEPDGTWAHHGKFQEV